MTAGMKFAISIMRNMFPDDYHKWWEKIQGGSKLTKDRYMLIGYAVERLFTDTHRKIKIATFVCEYLNGEKGVLQNETSDALEAESNLGGRY